MVGTRTLGHELDRSRESTPTMCGVRDACLRVDRVRNVPSMHLILSLLRARCTVRVRVCWLGCAQAEAVLAAAPGSGGSAGGCEGPPRAARHDRIRGITPSLTVRARAECNRYGLS